MDISSLPKHWNGRTAVLGTMHHKESVIAPLFARALGMDVIVPDKFDTDTFGTFTREITRPSNQLETARQKALAAMEATNTLVGVASEGSFGPHPDIPFITHNLELVVLIDRVHDLEIIGHHRSNNPPLYTHTATSTTDALDKAQEWGFPAQGVIVRQTKTSSRHLYKELTTVTELRDCVDRLLSQPFISSVFLETDMRAHRCPPRRHAIHQATEDLIRNCCSLCLNCQTPGFSITSTKTGLPCLACGHPTDLVQETIYSCHTCGHQQTTTRTDKLAADPAECELCNP
jgi:DNA-directed RNA polymerase subunit RPC12/RpoP